MTQMIARFKVADFAKFRTEFDADNPRRSHNSLNLLQLWRESDTDAWALFEVTDAARANTYISVMKAIFGPKAGVQTSEFHFVETA
ncbi:hypothetical protein ACHFJ0_15790 [Paracoccus sp. NGMCC 1.201697]|uniref:Uncharacterized protein n=1 Tax=Paracoccus broussonetiae subsp. drimophilus TaxID=3373869 RepID=A0ABW7LND8_9RHOB